MKKKNNLFLVYYIVYRFNFTTGNQCLPYCIQTRSGILYLTGQPYCKKSRSAKVKHGIINLFLRNFLVDRYKGLTSQSTTKKRGKWANPKILKKKN